MLGESIEMEKLEEKPKKNIFKDSILFPTMTMGSKVLFMSVIVGDNQNIPSLEGSSKIIANYLVGSAIFDMLELVYRVYGKHEIDYLGTEEEYSIPFSCFERHLIYDLPKYVWKKIKRE